MKKDYSKVVQERPSVEELQKARGDEVSNDEKKTVRITTAKPMKKSVYSKIGNAIFGPRGIRSITSYVSQEVVVPAIKGTIVDGLIAGVTSAVDGLIAGITSAAYGEDASGYKPRSSYTTPRSNRYTNYTNRYNNSRPATNSYQRNVRASNRVEEYAIENRMDAADVLGKLQEIADKYGSVTVADYYEMIGVHTEYTDNNYGWVVDDIARTNILRVPNGFVLSLPNARSLV